MAKLNVTIPVADVEINGAKYRKVERSAQEGDVIRITDEDAPSYVIDGAFYEVDEIDGAGDPQITDEDGDSYDAGGNLTFEVYEKVTEEPALQPAGPERLKVGEYVKVTSRRCGHGFKIGTLVKIEEDRGHNYQASALDGSVYWFVTDDEVVRATDDEVTAAKAQLFNIGDTVKLMLADGQTPKFKFGKVKNGDIGKVTEVSSTRVRVDFPSQSDWNAVPSELAKLTAEEVAEIERKKAEEAAREAERAKWAKIGRKVNEFKRGDIVEVMESGSSGYRVGLVDVVTHGDDDVLRLSTGTVRTCPWIVSSRVKLIAPIEQRFDRAS